MKKKPLSDRPKPLDPREAADRFMREATHDWQAALAALVRVVLEAKRKDGVA